MALNLMQTATLRRPARAPGNWPPGRALTLQPARGRACWSGARPVWATFDGPHAGPPTTWATTSSARATGSGCAPASAWWSSPGAPTRRPFSAGIRCRSARAVRAPRRWPLWFSRWRTLRLALVGLRRQAHAGSAGMPAPAGAGRGIALARARCAKRLAAGAPSNAHPGHAAPTAHELGRDRVAADNSSAWPGPNHPSTTSSATGSWTWPPSVSRSAAIRPPA